MQSFFLSFLRRRLWAVVGLLMALWGGSTALAAPTFQAAGVPAAAATATSPASPAWPAHAVGDIALLFIETKGGQAANLTVPAGFAAVPGTPIINGTRTQLTVYWARATSTAMPAPTIGATLDHIASVILTYRGVIGTGNPFDVTGGNFNASSSTSMSVSSITTTVPDTLIVQMAARDSDSAATSYFNTKTNANLTGITERIETGTAVGGGGGLGVWDGVWASAGATGVTVVTTLSARNAWFSLALKPPASTTLATGTDPVATTIAPGAAATDVNNFILQTSSGTEAITSVTVNLSTNVGVGRLAITDNAGTELGFTAAPITGSNTITVTGMTATTTLTNFKVRVTPLSHAAMPAVPGASYAITAPVTAWVGPNPHLGSDTNIVALSIDNQSPSSATATSGAAGNTQTTLNWTTSVTTDFSQSVVLRWLGVTAGAEVPAEGGIYTNGNVIGTATVACVRTDAASTTVSGVDGAGTGGCSAMALTNGQAYTYKIFQRDSRGNYSAGVTVGTFSPSVSTTLGTGTDPAAVTIAPGAGATDVNGFTFITSNATETITSVTVNLSTASGVGRLSITNSAGTELGFTTSAVNGTNVITLTTNITATTTITAYKVRVTPLSHAAMPVPPGGAYAITAPVTAWAGPNTHDGTDANPNALTIDNLSPTSATSTSTAAGVAQITLNWTTSVATDFSRSVVLRWLGSVAGTEVPSEGADYTAGNSIGSATVACMRNADAVSTSVSGVDGAGTGGCTGSSLTNGQAYTYKIFQKDANGNYDVGVVAGTATPSAIPPPAVTSFNAFESSTAPGATTGRIYTKLAGTGFVLDVVAIASGAQSSSFSGNAKVELLANNTPGAGYGADNCPTLSAVIQTIASTAIASGRSAVSFAAVTNAYRDVRVRVSYPVAAPTVTTCSTDSFAIRPVAFTISSTNATNTATDGATIFKTGANFNLTATTEVGYDGTPALAATPQVLGSPTAGVLAGTFGAASGGVAAGNAFTYSEVGHFGLNANAVIDTSFTSIDQTDDCTADFSTALASGKYGCNIGSNPVAQTVGSSGFGRFIPDHFAITAGAATPACGAFTYFGQDGFATAFTVTAQNATNATTVNYTGAYAKLDLANYTRYGFTAATLPAGSSLATGATAPTGIWANGVANVTARHQIARPAAPTVETGITISAAPTDGEVPAVTAAAVHAAATNFRFGRLLIQNAFGSELLNLPVPMEAQFWTTTGWVHNAADNCTVVPMASISMGNYQRNLNACETQLPAGNDPMVAGRLNLNLARPGVNNTGSVDLAINAGAATGNTCVAAAESPAISANLPWFGPNRGGRVLFGAFRSRFIYLRENY